MRKFDLTKTKKGGIILLYGKALQSEGRTEAAVRQRGVCAMLHKEGDGYGLRIEV